MQGVFDHDCHFVTLVVHVHVYSTEGAICYLYCCQDPGWAEKRGNLEDLGSAQALRPLKGPGWARPLNEAWLAL